jgi:hypothetical protein
MFVCPSLEFPSRSFRLFETLFHLSGSL